MEHTLTKQRCIFHTGSGGASAKRQIVTPATPPPAMTSGNESEAPTVTGSAPQNGENKPPQAIVKPQVLTHVIEGFVIQEGAEPFPVCVSGSAARQINLPHPPAARLHALPRARLRGAVSGKMQSLNHGQRLTAPV